MKDQEFERKLLEMKLQHPLLISKEEEENAWREIMLEIDLGKNQKSPKWWLIAASIAIAISICWWIIPRAEDTYVTGQREQLDIQLADNSRIKLNSNSMLIVKNSFNQSERRVYLKGEAFFNVEKNSDKPFVIELNNRKVKVLGTSFLVKNKGKSTTVSVRTGEVQLSSETATHILKAKQKGRIVANGKIVQETWDANEYAWYSGTLIFENKSMKEVAKTLSRLSNKPVEVSEKIANCKLSLKIDYERINEVFEIIAETLELSWTEEPKRIYFDGKGC